MSRLLAADGRLLVVAVDHPLYSWPCHGLEDRAALIEAVALAGADAVIASYGTIRDHRSAFGSSQPILKLDLTTVALGGEYPSTEYVQAWSVEDAQRLGVGAVLTFVQLGASFELEALRTAGRVAAEADRAGLQYVCEIMPVQSAGFPKDDAPDAIAAAARTGSELGAHVIKTTMPDPPGAIREAASCAAPVILAGGARAHDTAALLDSVSRALAAGASGVAFGRNVWGAEDPSAIVSRLHAVVHGDAASPPATATDTEPT
jgi:DhnA family fructose-bisphosphate aldolase class Ia